MSKKYQVIWNMEVTATNPIEAATIAKAEQLDPVTEHRSFQVLDLETFDDKLVTLNLRKNTDTIH